MFKQNRKGISLVYVMICLIIIGLTASALIKVSHKNALVQIQYSRSESARLAVHAGFEKALAFFESDKEAEILPLLQEWVDKESPDKITNTHKWIIGKQDVFDTLYTDCKFKVQLLGFDTSNFAISLHAEGESGTGHKASAVGTYILNGLGYDNKNSFYPTNALYLGSGADEINTQLIVNGNTYMNESGQFYVGGHILRGEFRRRANGNNSELYLNNTTFEGPAYFIDGNVKFEGQKSTFKKGIGGGARFEVSGTNGPRVTGVGAFFNSTLRFIGGVWNGNMQLNGTPLHGVAPASNYGAGSGDGLPVLYTNGSAPSNAPGVLENSPMNIPNKLNISPDDPPKIEIDLDAIRAHSGIINYSPGTALPGISAKSNLTGSDLNNLYNNNKSRYYKSKWLIVNMQSGDGSLPFAKGGIGFSGKMILLVEDVNMQVSTDLYESASDGITFLYLGSDKQITQFGGSSQFRGFIYANSTKSGSGNQCSLIMKSDPALHVKGSIYCVNSGHYRMEGGSPLTISYDSLVLKELADIGVFIDPSDTVSTSSNLVFKEPRLSADLLSRSF